MRLHSCQLLPWVTVYYSVTLTYWAPPNIYSSDHIYFYCASPPRCTILWGKAWSDCVTTYNELRAGKRLREQHNCWSWDPPPPVAACEDALLLPGLFVKCLVEGELQDCFTMLSQAWLFKQCFPSSFYCEGCCARHTWTGATEPSSAVAGTAAGNNCSSQEWPRSHHYYKPVRMSLKLQPGCK